MKDYEYRLNETEAERWREAHDAYIKWIDLKKHLENHRKIAKARAANEGATRVKVITPDRTVLEDFEV